MVSPVIRKNMPLLPSFYVSVVLVEDDQGGDHSGDPSGAGKKQDDKDGTAALVYHGERREDD